VEVRRAQCIAASWVSLQLLSGGAYVEATGLLDAAQRTAGNLWTADPTVAGWMHRALAIRASFEGDSGRFLEQAERAAAYFEEAGDVRNACLQRSSAGSAYCELGAYADAEHALRGVIGSAERLGIPNVVAAAQHVLGRALARTGKFGEARAAEEYAVEAFKGRAYPRMEGASRAYLADILIASGKLDQAEAHARAAAELLLVSPAAHVYALGMLARVQLAKGLPAEALVTAKDAVDKLESLGGIEEGEAMVRLAYAEALHAKGEHDAAKTEILAARDRLLTRAQKIEDERWRTSFLSAVPEHARPLTLAKKRA
jgi:tetratricopeptide (TPR) repeat protein